MKQNKKNRNIFLFDCNYTLLISKILMYSCIKFSSWSCEGTVRRIGSCAGNIFGPKPKAFIAGECEHHFRGTFAPYLGDLQTRG